ncbi:MAG TPA: hypothetical protein VHJ20_04405 [Polyangia bacterium]|nr:hypothetical protein [Polyangia bacterium]
MRARNNIVVVAVALAAVSMVAFAGCHRRPKTPEDAYRRFTEAVTAQDGRALFDALDQKTRWDWMSIQKYHREAYDIVLSTFPDGEREREAKRFEAGATATSAREMFRAHVAGGLAVYVPLAVADARIETDPSGTTAAAVLVSGARVPLARGDDGSWGFAGLASQAEDIKVRASHDLEVVRASAADYERAATRAVK